MLASAQIVLAAPPTGDFSFVPAVPQPGDPVSFSATAEDDDAPVVITWDFEDDGLPDSAGDSPTHTYDTAGTRTVRMTLTAGTDVTEVTKVIRVNARPTAAFGFAPAAPEVGEQVSFNAATSGDDTGIVAYAWDFDDDGAYDDGAGVSPTHAFTSAGDQTVGLRVTDGDGITDTVSRTLTVTANPPPVARFTASDPRPEIGQSVTFDASTTTDDEALAADDYAWNFDADPAVDARGVTVSFTFSTSGAKTVTLTVTDADGATDTATGTVTVNAAPTADFSFTPVAPQPGSSVTFRATATDDAALPAGAYAWDTDGDAIVDFNDGTTAEVTRSYPTPGARTIRLRVTDSDGTTATVTKVVTVNARPLADFTVTPGTPRLREPMKFTSTSRDPDTATAADPDGNLTYAWDLDQDGAYDDSTAAAPTLPTGYATPGIKRVRLRVTDNTGATSDKERAFEVQEVAPIGSFTFSPANPLPGQVVTFRSTSVPSPGAKITSLEWDFDGNSVIDATGAVVTHEFQTAGPRTVSLKVTEDSGGYDAHSAVVTVNAPPIAAIRFAPPSPYVGDAVDFASLSRDPDGYLASEAWDTDGDGAFDDATGKVAARSFRTAGAHIVRLRVVDGLGAAAVQSVTVNVVRRPPPPKPELDVIEPGIRLSLVPGTTRIRRLHVRAPKGAKIKISCKGRGCPRRKASSTRSRGKLVRVRWLERRLRAGTKIVVAVTQKGKIGSHTTLVIRRSGAPRRVRCLMPGSAKPKRCPA